LEKPIQDEVEEDPGESGNMFKLVRIEYDKD
jgi:hypothetical protein